MGKTWTVKRKPAEGKPKTVTEMLTEIEDAICNDYCKYQDLALKERDDPDEAEMLLYEKYCASCPMNRL